MSPGRAVTPPRRLIALGASNLTRALPTLVADVRATAGGPVEVIAACGHGRSFGMSSRYLAVRGLPGVLGSGLWRALDERPEAPTVALVTDIGNDIAYGVAPSTLAGWVTTCLDRLADHGVRPLVVLPPSAPIASLPRWRFTLASWLLFPGRGLDQAHVIGAIDQVARRVEDAAVARRLVTLRPSARWYGVDPIHLTRAGRASLHAVLRAAWGLPERPASPSLGRTLVIRAAPAAETRWLGMTVKRAQPACQLGDGSTVSLY